MKQVIKAMVALGIALMIVFAVRAYAFTIYSVPSDIGMMLRRGDRVMVNRLAHAVLKRGDLVVFRFHGDMIGKIRSLPGDTIKVGQKQFVIPYKCCNRCSCPDCKLYLVDTGHGELLMYEHQVIGRAFRLFYLPF